MPRPIRSFAERQAEKDKHEALETVTMTERLLAHILIELMETRGRRGPAALARRLEVIGFSTKAAAALLDTTPASLAVAKQRERVDES
jgi:hypothetical protein